MPPGQIRLKGHFTGVVTTASHCLDISVPLSYEVPLGALEPALLAFLEAQKEAEAMSPGGDFEAEQLQMESRVWQDLIAIVHADKKGQDSRAREIMKIAQHGKRGGRTAGDPQLQRIEEKEAALEVDLEAKEELLEKVMEERERLRAENEDLKDKQEGQGSLTSFVKRATHVLVEGVQEVEHILGLEEDEPEKEDPQVRVQDKVGDAGAVGEGCILLSGHFAGSVITRSHHLEVALPVEGPVPGAPLVEIVGSLAGEPDANGKRQVRVSSPEAAVDPKVWRRLLALLRAEIPSDRAPQAQIPVRDGAAEPSLQQELQQLRGELERRSRELEEARDSHSRLRLEADNLRARNSALSGYLASAETNAQKLRSTLSHAGVAGALPQDSHRRHAGAVARTALAEADGDAARTAQRPQRPQPLDFPGQADPAAPPPPTSTVTQEAAVPKTFAPSTVSPLNSARGFCAGERPPAALFRSPPCSTSSTPPRSATPPGGRRPEATPRLKLSDAALVADLQELEWWAKELRALKGS